MSHIFKVPKISVHHLKCSVSQSTCRLAVNPRMISPLLGNLLQPLTITEQCLGLCGFPGSITEGSGTLGIVGEWLVGQKVMYKDPGQL